MIIHKSPNIVCATSILSESFVSAFTSFIYPIATCESNSYKLKYDWDILEAAKLVIFTGGADINPAIYGQENTMSEFNPLRDTAEIEVLRRALYLGKKILGVCRGHQLINAWLGGELVQDIPTYLNTVHEADHPLEVLEASGVIPNLYNEVNSIHHQGVVKVGEGLKPTTYWRGVFESTENDNILTVQFHPEWMYEQDNIAKLTLWDYLDAWAKLGLEASA